MTGLRLPALSLFGKFLLSGLWLLLLWGMTVSAQEIASYPQDKKAVKAYHESLEAYRKNDLPKALADIEKALKRAPGWAEAHLLHAELLADDHRNSDALTAYACALSLDSLRWPELPRVMALLAVDEGNPGMADSLLSLPLAVTADSVVRQRRLLLRRQVRAMLFWKEVAPELHVVEAPDSLNSPADEYINFVDYAGQQLVLTRKEKKDSVRRGEQQYRETFLKSHRDGALWNRPVAMDLPWLGEKNAGGVSFSADGRSMLFTGCYWPDGQGSCDLYYSNRKGEQWERPGAFNRRVNTASWESQPAITADGSTIYFASKRSGGHGGSDLWVTRYLKGKGWTEPVNLGDSINTAGDEMAPMIHADGMTLYYASNGWPGNGGYDLYMSRRDATGQWSQALNLGNVINTPDDELNLFVDIDGHTGWLTSDRTGSRGGFDIWTFDLPESMKPRPLITMWGVVVDSVTRNPVAAELRLMSWPDARVLRTIRADSLTGEFMLTTLREEPCFLQADYPGYWFYSSLLDSAMLLVSDTIPRVVALQPVKKGERVNLHRILFAFNSDELLPSSLPELQQLLALLKTNEQLQITIIGHTDDIGGHTYNQQLSERRALSVKAFLVANGVDPHRMLCRGEGDSRPIADNNTAKGQALNRRTEIEVR